jgi:HK97 family phage major capsid protein
MITLADLEALRTPEEYANLQANARARMKDLDAEFGVKPFTPEAQSEWASLDEVDKELSARITEGNARRKRIADLATGPTVDGPFTGRTIAQKAKHVPDDIFALEQYRNLSGSEPELLQAYRDGAMFATDHASYPNPQSKRDVEQEHIANLIDQADRPTQHNPSRELSRRILATGSPLYLQAFTNYVLGKPLSPDQMRAAAAAVSLADGAGGYAVPFYFDPTLLHVGAWTNINPYRQVCTTKTIVGTDTYNGVTVGAFTVARSAEAAAPAQGMADDSFGAISAIVCEVKGFAGISLSMLQDRPDIVSELASLISEAKDTEEESSFSVGAGGGVGNGYAPIGMFGAAHDTSGAYTHIDTAAADGAAAAVDAYSMEAAIPLRHRKNAVWFMNRQMIRIWQALETSGGQLFGGQYYNRTGYPQISPVGNTGLALLNYPIYETPSAPAIVLATDDLVVSALVNPATYYIIERAGMSVETIPHLLDQATGRPSGQRGIYAWWRNTAKPATVNGGRRLAFKA